MEPENKPPTPVGWSAGGVIAGLVFGAVIGWVPGFGMLLTYSESPQHVKPPIGPIVIGIVVTGALGIWLSTRVKGFWGSLLMGLLIGGLGIFGICTLMTGG